MKLFNIKILTVLCLLVGVTIVTSCDDDEVGTDEVTLLSFGPAGVKHGEEIIFIGTNLDKVTAIVFRPEVEVPASAFTLQTAAQIKLAVPDAAEAGTVILKTPDGDIESISPMSFEVPVEITSITAEAKPGTEITLTGDKLNWIEMITFTDGLEVEQADFVSATLTELKVVVPMTAQTGYLIFSTGGTEPLTFASENPLTVTLPAITSMTAAMRHTEPLTIAGTDLDLVTEIVFQGRNADESAVSVTADGFTSQSETEIVVNVPSPAEAGTITLKQLSPVDVVSADGITIILPAGSGITPSPATPGEDDVTITGTELDQIAELIFTGADPIAASAFVSQSATEIVVSVPATAEQGAVKYTTIHGYSAGLGVVLVLPGDAPPPLPIEMYDDAIGFGGGNWGWGGTSDYASTENFYSGSISAKFVPDADNGGASVGGMSAIDATGQEVFTFAIYGGTGTDGMQVAAILNDTWGNYNAVTVVEGEWTVYELEYALYPDVDFSAITRWILKPEGTSGGEIFYFDRIGFGLPLGPPALDYVVYDESVSADFGTGGGWGGGTADFANIEQARSGSNSIKVTWAGDWGGNAQFGTWDKPNLDVSSYSKFAFSVYGGAGTDGMELNVNVKLDTDNAQVVTITEGEWVDVEIDLSTFGSFTEITEIWFQDRGWSGDIYIDYIGFRY